MNLFGLKIVQHQLALEIRTEWRVERNPIQKKRRQWCVRKYVINRPGCFVSNDVVYLHPELYAKLKGNAS